MAEHPQASKQIHHQTAKQTTNQQSHANPAESTAHKTEEKHPGMEEEEIKKMISHLNIQITEGELKEYVATGGKKDEKQFEQWYSSRKSIQIQHKIQNQEQKPTSHEQKPSSHEEKPKAIDQKHKEQKLKEEKPKEVELKKTHIETEKKDNHVAETKEKEKQTKAAENHQKEKPKEQTPQEITNLFFSEYKVDAEIKFKQISAISKVVGSKVTKKQLKAFFKEHDKHTLHDFSEWHSKKFAAQTNLVAAQLSKNPIQFLTKIDDLAKLYKATQKKEVIDVNIQMGDGKGKTDLKLGYSFSGDQGKDVKLNIEIKAKKPQDLKTYIENELKKVSAEEENKQASLFNLIDVDVIATEKSVQISIASSAFSTIFKDSIHKIEGYKFEKDAAKVQIELVAKPTIKDHQNQKNSNKKIIKWLGEGFLLRLKTEGGKSFSNNYLNDFADVFPALKVIKSGQIKLKVKNPQNLNKFLAKLGIQEIVEETPTVKSSIEDLLKPLHSFLKHEFKFLQIILQSIISFCSNQPTDKVSLTATLIFSHFKGVLTASVQGASLLKDIFHGFHNKKQQ